MALENQAASAGLRIKRTEDQSRSHRLCKLESTFYNRRKKKVEEVANFTILAVSSPQMGMQNEMSSAASAKHLLCSSDSVQSGTRLPSLCRLNCDSWLRSLYRRRPTHARPGR